MKQGNNFKQSALGLMEVLIALVVMASLSVMLGYVVKAMATVQVQQANKITQGAMNEVQEAYTRFIAEGGWIDDNTHITDILNRLDAPNVYTTSAHSINGFSPNTTLSCGSPNTCYELANGAVVGVLRRQGAVNGDNGYFAPSISGNMEVAGVTTQAIIIDPDGLANTTDANSASLILYLDELGRLGVARNGNGIQQPTYFNLER